MPLGPKVSPWILVRTSGQGLDRSQISDWVTGLSVSQPWPAEMGVVFRGCGVEIRKVSGFDKGRQDSQVSESESIAACLPNFFFPALSLPVSIFLHNLLSKKNTKTDQSGFQECNEWIYGLFWWGFIFPLFKCSVKIVPSAKCSFPNTSFECIYNFSFG